MDIPKFSARRDEAKRKPGQAPASIKEMSWMQHKVPTTYDLLTGRLLGLVLVFGLLVVAAGMLRSRAKTHTSEGLFHQVIDSSRGHQNPVLPGKPHPTVSKRVEGELVGPDGKPAAAPAGEEATGAEAEAKSEAAKTEAPTPPAGETKSATAEADNRKRFSLEESKIRKFQNPVDKFEPLELLDPKAEDFVNAFDVVYDEDVKSAAGLVNASELDHASTAMHLFYRFLRTNEKSPEKVEAYYKDRYAALKAALGDNRASANHHNVMNSPEHYRGQLYKFAGSLIKKFQIRNWSWDEDNNSGIRDTWMVICRDDKLRFYAVLVPQDVNHFRSKDDVDAPDRVMWSGLFLQRWAYVRADNQWDTMPVYVALKLDPLEIPKSDNGAMLVGIALALIVGLVLIVRMIRRDEKKGEDLLRALRQRPVKPKPGTASAQSAQPPPEPPAPGPVGDPASASPPAP